MIESLFWVGSLSIIIGMVLLFLGVGGKVSADTEFGKFSGSVGGVCIVLGIVLTAIAVLA